MAKRTLTITKFDGGLNCFSDARDIQDNEFFQNWNAVVDKAGVVRVSGEGHRYIKSLPHDHTNIKPGYGLYSFSADYTLNLLKGTKGIEKGTCSASSTDKSVTLATAPSNVTTANYATNDYFNERTIVFYTGEDNDVRDWSIKGTRFIEDYDGSTKVATVNKQVVITTSTKYIIYPWRLDCFFGQRPNLKGTTGASGPYLSTDAGNAGDILSSDGAHGLITHAHLLYISQSGNSINGLTDGTSAYVEDVDDDDDAFKLWTTPESAGDGAEDGGKVNSVPNRRGAKYLITDHAGTGDEGERFYLNHTKNSTANSIRNLIAGPELMKEHYGTTINALSATDTIVYLENGDAKSLLLAAGEDMKFHHDSDSAANNREVVEIVDIAYANTDYDGSTKYDKITIARGREGSSANSHTAGAKVSLIHGDGPGKSYNSSLYFKTVSEDIISARGQYLGRMMYDETGAGTVQNAISNGATNFNSGGKWAVSGDFAKADISGAAGGLTYTHSAGAGTASQTANNRTTFGKSTSVNGVLLKMTYYIAGLIDGVTGFKLLGGFNEFAENDEGIELSLSQGQHEVYFTGRSDRGKYSTGIQVDGAVSESSGSVGITVKTISATSSIGSSLILNVGDTIYAHSTDYSASPTSIGVITAIGSSTSITVGGGTSADLANNDYIYVHDSAATNNFTISATSSGAGVFKILYCKLQAVGNSGLELIPGTNYNLRFYARLKHKYENAISDVFTASTETQHNVAFADRLPHVLLYNDSVSNLITGDTGLYLQSDGDGPQWSSGQNNVHSYLHSNPQNMNKIVNGDFGKGSISSNDFSGTGVGWTYNDTSSGDDVALTMYSSDSVVDGLEQRVFQSYGNSLKMAPDANFSIDEDTKEPSGYIYQDVELKDNTRYVMAFAYGSAKGQLRYSMEDRTDTSDVKYLTFGGDSASPESRYRNLPAGGTTKLEEEEEVERIKWRYPSDITNDIHIDSLHGFNYITFTTPDYRGFFKTGVQLAAAYAVGKNDAITVDNGSGGDPNADDVISVGDIIYTSSLSTSKKTTPEEVGIVTAVATTSVTIAGGTKIALVDNDYIYLKKSKVTVRVAFAPSPIEDGLANSHAVLLDSVSLQKGWPDLLTMSRTNLKYVNPFFESGDWIKYSLEFSVPADYQTSSAWTLAIDGGMYTYGQGASGAHSWQEIDFDRFRLTKETPEDLILLSDNAATNSNIHIYSETNKEWTENFIDWSGLNSKPVFSHINGGIKISDGNFDNDNNNNNIYYRKTKIFGGYSKEGWFKTDKIIPPPPPLRVLESGQSSLISFIYDGRKYLEKLFGNRTFRGQFKKPWKRTNWEMDRLGSTGIVMTYIRSYAPSRVSTSRLQNNERYEYSEYGLGGVNDATPSHPNIRDNTPPVGDNAQPRRNPVHLLIRGDDGTTIDDTGGQGGGYDIKTKLVEKGYSDTLQIAKIELDLRYDFRASQQHNFVWSRGRWDAQSPPAMEIKAGKVVSGTVNNDIRTTYEWGGGLDNIQKIVNGDIDGLGWSIKYNRDEDLWEKSKEDIDDDKTWARSSWWPKTTIEDSDADKWIRGTHPFTASIDLADIDGHKLMSDEDIAISIKVLHNHGSGTDDGNSETDMNRILYYNSFAHWLGKKGESTDIKHHYHKFYRRSTSSLDNYWKTSGDESIITDADNVAPYKYGYSQFDFPERHPFYSEGNIAYGRFQPSKDFIDAYFDYTGSDTYQPYNFSRWERVIVDGIRVYFFNPEFDDEEDGQSASLSDYTTCNFNFNVEDEIEPTGWARKSFKVGVTTVNEFEEESHISVCETILGEDIAGERIIQEGASPTATVFVGSDICRKIKIKKLKYYLKDTDSDIWYLQFYVDLITNKIHTTTSNYSRTGIQMVSNKHIEYSIHRKYLANFNEVNSYESETQVDAKIAENTGENLSCRYKAAVVANDRLYVGNVKFGDRVHGDRMIKSPPHKYNILPSSNYIDVVVNDGDEITALEYFQDKILQFKKKKVFIIDISGETEFLSDTLDSVGVRQQSQVTRTKYGIAWATPDGCFLYDGKQIHNLIEKKIPTSSDLSSISNNYWSISYINDDVPSIEYNQERDTLLVSRTSNELSVVAGAGGFEYHFPTRSWVFLNNKLTGTHNATQALLTNMTLNKDGDIIYAGKRTGESTNIYKWSDASSTDNEASGTSYSAFYFTTRDFDFGDAAIRKKIYKVYVTYKTTDGVDSNVALYAAKNGSANSTEITFSAESKYAKGMSNSSGTDAYTSSTLNETDGKWLTAELKFSNPSDVNNIYSLQLFFDAGVNAVEGFEINDISIIYRFKNPR